MIAARKSKFGMGYIAHLAWGVAVLCILVVPSSAAAQTVVPKIGLERLWPNQTFSFPVHIAPIPDGSGDMAIVEQAGVIRRIHPGGTRDAVVFLDIRSRVSRGGWEEGLLSVAFHPQYQRNGFFYVYYSAAGPRRSVVARLETKGRTRAMPSADGLGGGEVLLEIRQPYANHNGGMIAFGPDGMLYIGLGDGGSGGDPRGNGQNRRTLLGSILRIDVDRTSGGRAYGIPPDNPFVSSGDGSRPEIWAYGLRNPWRFSFDRASGALWAADVGQNRIEEVNRVVKGGNYGWNRMEGRSCYRPSSGCREGSMLLPLTEYGHGQGNSITGGYVYRGRAIPELSGRYVFADFGSGSFWSIAAGTERYTPPAPLLNSRLQVSSFGEDLQGELYVADLRGGIYRLIRAR